MKFSGKKAAYQTLGCKLNFAETSTIGRMLQEMGVLTAREGERADICIINTCSVTDVADHKCRQAISRMARDHEGAFIVVTGCYAQLQPERLSSMQGVDLVVGTHEKALLRQLLTERWAEALEAGEGRKPLHQHLTSERKLIESFVPSCAQGDRTRWFLKVQDGCDRFCTYCTIPMARGKSRNAPISDLVDQAREAAREGAMEIVITGVNIGDFGKTTGEHLLDLLERLDEVESIKRFRISSLEPDHISDQLIDFIARSRAFMPHFHLPLQSGSNRMLRLMGRHYDQSLFARKVQAIKERMPEAFIGVDVMVGCRGETPDMFEETLLLLTNLDVSKLHVFPYSERPGTAALKIPLKVDEEEKKRRSRLLLDLSARKMRSFYERHVGREAEVLLERPQQGKAMHGFTENYIRVELPLETASMKDENQIVRVRLRGLNADDSLVLAERLE